MVHRALEMPSKVDNDSTGTLIREAIERIPIAREQFLADVFLIR